MFEQVHTRSEPSFEDDEDKTDVSDRKERFLPDFEKYVGQRQAVNDPNDDGSDNAGPENDRRQPFCEGQEEEERNQDQDQDDCRVDQRSWQMMFGMRYLLEGSSYARNDPTMLNF